MATNKKESYEIEFYTTIIDLAQKDGVLHLISVPEIWKTIVQHYRNNAIKYLQESKGHQDKSRK